MLFVTFSSGDSYAIMHLFLFVRKITQKVVSQLGQIFRVSGLCQGQVDFEHLNTEDSQIFFTWAKDNYILSTLHTERFTGGQMFDTYS